MINIYDFDGTIYDGDSTVDFFFFCLKKKPYIAIYLPLFFVYSILYLCGVVSKEKMKDKFFKFLNFFSDIDNIINEFWEFNIKKIKKFYLNKNHRKDVIISASPYFLLEPICNKLDIKKLIASPVNKCTGKYEGNNCCGEEKVKRLKEELKRFNVNEVYSDSYKDIPLWRLSKKTYLVRKNDILKINVDEIEEKSEKKFDRYIVFLFVFFMIFSLFFLNLLLVGKYDLKFFKYLILLNFIVSIIVAIKISTIFQSKINKKLFFVSFFVGLYSCSCLKEFCENGAIYLRNLFDRYLAIDISFNYSKYIISINSLFSLIFLCYYLFNLCCPFIKKFFMELDKVEKNFLVLITVLGAVLCFLFYCKTNVFYKPVYISGKFVEYDVLFTTDSGYLSLTNAYGNIGCLENDMRQPLFGLFALPFSIFSQFLSSFISFIPNGYYIIFSIVQIFLIGLSFIMIGKMLNLRHNKILFYIFSFSTYTMLIFPFIYEQYIIALFYLILTIYIGYYHKLEINYMYCGAVGTLLTSGVIFPYISSFYNFRKWLKNVLKCFVFFVILVILSGQVLMLFDIAKRFNSLMKFSGGNLSFYSKLIQFLYFVRSLFIRPLTTVVVNVVPRYWLTNIKSISFVGVGILLLCFISLIINRKNKFAWICMLWIAFSFLILCLFGWGTQENGLILYSLYFFWAYCSLLIMLIDKIKNNLYRNSLFLFLVILLFCINIPGLIDIVSFGIKYFPFNL